MPADRDELRAWVESTCTRTTTYPNGCTSSYLDVSEQYALGLAKDLGAALLYGPSYSRQAWENYCDSVRAWHRGDYAGAGLFRERAEAAAGIARESRRLADGGRQVRIAGEWFHAVSSADRSPEWRGAAGSCGYCYLGAPHTARAHEESDGYYAGRQVAPMAS